MPLSLLVLPGSGATSSLLTVLVVFFAFVAAESIALHFEIRRQSFDCSASELAFVVALVELGGVWTAVARVAAVGLVLAVQHLPPAKILFNVAAAAIEVCVAVAVLRVLPVGDIT